MKILIIRFSAIGDIVWCTPVVRMLKKQLPHATLHFATKPQYRAMLASNPYLDKLHLLENKDLPALVAQLRAENFDAVVDLHQNLRSWRIRWALGKPTYAYDKQNWRRWLLVYFKIDLVRVHICDRYQRAVRPLGVLPDGAGLDYFIAPQDEVPTDALPPSHRGDYAALVIGASRFTKRLPPDKLAELAARIPLPLVLVGGPEDRPAGDALAQTDPDRIWNACGQFNLSQSASLVKQASVVFGHDTGLTHIAAAFRKKVFIVFGSTSPSGYYPYATPYQVLQHENLWCRPCSRSGRDRCPLGHFKCLRQLPLDFTLE